MKRRKFLKGGIGMLAGGVGFSDVLADPCWPQLSDAPQPNCGSPDGNLAETALALEPGQSADFVPNTLQHPQDIQWQNQSIFYDATRRELQYMGKPASSQSTNHSHYIFNEDAGQWSTTGRSLFPGGGHIWYPTFDPVNGDYYYRQQGSDSIHWYDRSDGPNGTWKRTVRQTSPALDGGSSQFAAMGYHPNLMGPGKPGILAWAVWRFFAYDLESESFRVLNPSNFPSGGPYWNRNTGQALYLPETDQLICFARQRDNNGHPAVLVEAGAGLSSDVFADDLVSLTGTPPIQVYGGGGMANHGHVVNHPADPNVLLLLDEHGSSRVWRSDDFGSSWRLQSYTHPFQAMQNRSDGEYCVGIIPPYGVVIGMTSNGDGGDCVLWRPNS